MTVIYNYNSIVRASLFLLCLFLSLISRISFHHLKISETMKQKKGRTLFIHHILTAVSLIKLYGMRAFIKKTSDHINLI